MKVAVTGASGFVGTALVARLAADGSRQVRACSRTPVDRPAAGVEWRVSPGLGPNAEWVPLLEDVDVVVHLAARVHVMVRDSQESTLAFAETNVNGTRALAEQAARAGVKRLVFLSTIKVHGERGLVRSSSPVAPVGAYATSKCEAERALFNVGAATALEVVVIRPPLVYGPGVKANVAALTRAVLRGWPLPFGAIHNRRSLVGVDNLIDLIVCCLDHDRAAGRAWLVSDGEDVATPDLVRRIAAATGRPARLWPAPSWLLRSAGAAIGRADAASRLVDSLYVDMEETCATLGWSPRVSLNEGLRRMVGVP